MKKVISVLMVAVALMMAAPAQAQLFKLGLKGGMDFTKLDLNAESIKDVKDNNDIYNEANSHTGTDFCWASSIFYRYILWICNHTLRGNQNPPRSNP